MVTLGRWSYGLFVWHLAALAMVFPMIGEFPFNGHFTIVLVLTLLFGTAIAAVSYGLIESPSRNALRRWEMRHDPTPLDSSVDDPSHPWCRADGAASLRPRPRAPKPVPGTARRPNGRRSRRRTATGSG